MTLNTHFIRRVFDNGLDAVAAFDDNLRFIYWNDAMEEATSLLAESAVGASVYQLFPAMRETGLDEPLRAALRGEQRVVDAPFYGASSTAREYEWFVTPLHEGTRVSGGISVARSRSRGGDLAERMAETEQRFKIMADCSPVLLWMSGEDSLCNFFNQTWLEFSGKPLEEEVGVGWAAGVHPADFERCMDTYMRAFNARESFEMEYRLRRHDGAYRWILDRGSPRYSPAGVFAGFIGSCIDITDRKESEDQTRELAARLNKTNQHLERLLYAASHDLREPIRMVTSFLSLAERKLGGNDPQTAEFLAFARGGAERMRSTVDGLLDFARVREGTPSLEPVEIDDLVRDVCADLKCLIEENQARVVADGLPRMHADAIRLRIALQNLIANAIKFRTLAPPVVSLSAAREGDTWVIAVRDNGIGFDPQYAELAFGMFQRLHDREQFAGNGMGLAIVREVAALHGGRAWATSAPGQGSTFYLSLQEPT